MSSKTISKLAIILVGEDPASVLYVKRKLLKAAERGIETELVKFGDNVTERELVSRIQELDLDVAVRGIMVQLPLPIGLRGHTREILDTIDPKKDVDCLTTVNLKLLEEGRPIFYPAAVRAILGMLTELVGDFGDKACTVIGNSDLVGKPLTMALKNLGATVTVCDIDTPKKDFVEACEGADILVSATGVPHLIKKEMVRPGAIVIDVGIARDQNGKLVGDVDYEEVAKVASFVSPVPGGVGPRTVQALLDNFSSING